MKSSGFLLHSLKLPSRSHIVSDGPGCVILLKNDIILKVTQQRVILIHFECGRDVVREHTSVHSPWLVLPDSFPDYIITWSFWSISFQKSKLFRNWIKMTTWRWIKTIFTRNHINSFLSIFTMSFTPVSKKFRFWNETGPKRPCDNIIK